MSQQSGRPPEHKIRFGGISASVWRNTVEKDGRTLVRFSVCIQNQFFDKQSQTWKTTEYFFRDDLPRLEHVAAKVFDYICEREAEGDDSGCAA